MSDTSTAAAPQQTTQQSALDSLLTALNAILSVVQSGGTNVGADLNVAVPIIEALENLVPKLFVLGETYVQVAQNIIATLQGSVTDAELLARLSALQASVDADFDSAASAIDPTDAVAGQAAEAADKAADPNQTPVADQQQS